MMLAESPQSKRRRTGELVKNSLLNENFLPSFLVDAVMLPFPDFADQLPTLPIRKFPASS